MKRSPATYLDDDWTPSAADRQYASEHGFSEDRIDRIALDFRDHFTSHEGARYKHRRWDRTWQRWIRVEADRRSLAPNVVRFERPQDRDARAYRESIDRLKTG